MMEHKVIVPEDGNLRKFLEEEMTEHVCRWVAFTGISNYPVKNSNPPTVYSCETCQEEMHWNEVLHRLNATERLRAEDAKGIVGGLEELLEPNPFERVEPTQKCINILKAYAHELGPND